VWLQSNKLGEYVSSFEEQLGVKDLRDLASVEATQVETHFRPPMKPLDIQRFFVGANRDRPLQTLLAWSLRVKTEVIELD
jgi:hypothetical protein